jgi:serine/threonine-protein kinase NIM1
MAMTLNEIPEDPNEEEEKVDLTPYQKLLQAVHDSKFSHEVALEKRVGLYKFCGDIGRGNFSRVKKAVHLLTRDKVAIKIVDRSRLDTKNLRMLSREVSTLECVQHPYILRLFEVVETLGKVHLVTELIEGGELYYKIVQNGVYTEAKARKIFKQLSLAIQHMVC